MESEVEIAARFYESLAMTQKYFFCHSEERSDEAISVFFNYTAVMNSR